MEKNKKLVKKPTNETANKPSENELAMVTVKANKDFYVDGFRKNLSLSVILALGLVVSLGFNVFLGSKEPKIQNFAIDTSGRLIPIVPVNEPLVNESFIREFTSRAIMEIFQLSFNHYIQIMNRNQQYFTIKGFENFEKLFNAGIKPIITEKVMNSSATPTASPSIVKQGEYMGTYLWQLEVPFILTFEGTKGKITKNFVATVTVARVPQTLRGAGVAITGITLEERRG